MSKTSTCDCQKLVRILPNDALMPDHLCPETCQATCEAWVNSLYWPPSGRLYAHLPNGKFVDAGEIVVRDDKVVLDMPWPLPILPNLPADPGKQELFLVLREMVEAPMTESQMKTLEKTPTWWQSESLPEQWQGLVNFDDTEQTLAQKRELRRRLWQKGLPATHSMTEYVLQRAAGEAPEDLPSYGVLVTSFFVGTPLWRQPIGGRKAFASQRDAHLRRDDSEARLREASDCHLFTVSGGSLFMPMDVMRRIQPVVTKHQDFWRDLLHSNLPNDDARQGNGRKPGRAPSTEEAREYGKRIEGED
jgi:hypothetical protein